MPILKIKDMKVVAPSPDNFILDLEIENKGVSNHYKYIASGEQIYQNHDNIDSTLLKQHVAHSSIFKVNDTLITAFSLFDVNDMGITTDDYDSSNNSMFDNLLLMPNANIIPSARVDNPIPMHGINVNATYGYVKTPAEGSFGYPEYDENDEKFVMSTHNKEATGDPKPGVTDTLTLYQYRKYATNISNVLGLGKQTDISATEPGFDKLFVFDPTNDNRLNFKSSVRTWRSYQSNRNYTNGATNNFDNSTLLVRAILFPKQTLNNEYTTERDYVSSEVSAPFAFTRKYNFDDLEHFYSNGTHIILNHRDDTKFEFAEDTKNFGGTMVTSKYSRRFGDLYGKPHLSPEPPDGTQKIQELDTGDKVPFEIDYNKYGTLTYADSNITDVSGLFNQYSPELINRENETMSDTALMTSLHKTNVFDIEFSDDLWQSIAKPINKSDSIPSEAKAGITENIKQTIKTNLFKLVEEIKPAHTELYKITIDSDT
jgi:hypothetical protein